jgi:hypothetical protein
LRKRKRLTDAYRFRGFRPRSELKGVFGDPKARVISLERTGKKTFAEHVAESVGAFTIIKFAAFGIFPAQTLGFIWKCQYGESIARSVVE